MDGFELVKTGFTRDGHPLCAACGKRLTRFLIMPETNKAGSPVRFEICTTCQAEVVETLRLHSRRAGPRKLH
jgi:hypothetical protein